MKLDKIKLFVFDLDDTLYRGDEVLPGALELIEYLQQKYRVVFYTNNSSKTRHTIYKKLNRLGFKCLLHEVYNSGYFTALYLKRNNIDNVYVIGSNDLCTEIINREINIVQSRNAKNVVVGMDFDFGFGKMDIALSIVNKGGKFIACNSDRSFRISEEEELPACGSIVSSISYASNKSPYFIGKPESYGIKKIAKLFNVTKEEMIVVGDSESDIMSGFIYGCKSILVNGSKQSENQNLLIIKDLKDLLNYIKGERNECIRI